MPSSVTPRQLTRLSWPAKIPATIKHHDKYAYPDGAHSFTAFLWKIQQFNIRTQYIIATTLPVVSNSCHIHHDATSCHVALDTEHTSLVSNKVIFYTNLTNYNLQVLYSYIQHTHTHSHSHSYILDPKEIASSCHSVIHTTLESIKTSTLIQVPLIFYLN